MARPERPKPRAALADPDAPFLDGTVDPARPDADTALRAQQLARNLRAAVDRNGWGVRRAADETGVNYTRIYAVLRGDTYIDTHSLARLEARLGPLWPPP